jgi:uncharacterized repeat protein (TIGR02543 family)
MMKKSALFLGTILLVGILASCGGTSQQPLTFTVTFDTSGGTNIAPQQVVNGGKVSQPSNPEKDGFVFAGEWKLDQLIWNFAIDIVTDHMTLVAQWLEVTTTPTNIMMTSDPFSSTLSWRQTDAINQNFIVSMKQATLHYQDIDGTFDIDTSNILHRVT